MGAEYNEKTIVAKTDEEAIAAFTDEVASCEYDYGHSGYTGTFAEKLDVKILPPPNGQLFWNLGEIAKEADDADKWDEAIGGKISANEYYIGGWCSS